jgi:signal transduction histidine kinase
LNSLEHRLQLSLLIPLGVLAALLLWGGGLAVGGLVESFVASRLEHDAQALLGALRPPPGGHKGGPLRWRWLTPVYQQPFSGHYFQILLPEGKPIRSRSLWDQQLDIPRMEPGTSTLFRTSGPDDQQLLVWSGGFQRQDGQVTIAVAEDLTPIQADIRHYQWWLGAGIAGAMILLLLIQRRVIHQTMRRLEPVREEVRRLAQGRGGTLSEEVPDEVRPLVREFNRLLALLGSRLERSRNATGNLAHALKGPLSLLMQGLEADTLDDPRRRMLKDQVERLHRLTERELRRARLAGGGTPGQHFDPAAEVPALIESLRLMHRKKALRIDCTALPDAPLPCDREDLLELLGNLLDNACKWAATEVRFALEQDDDQLRIRVEDDGPGVPEAQLARLAGRGVRVDEAVDGHGLGLAIVQDIARLYRGELHFDRSPELKGLRVRVSLRFSA